MDNNKNNNKDSNKNNQDNQLNKDNKKHSNLPHSPNNNADKNPTRPDSSAQHRDTRDTQTGTLSPDISNQSLVLKDELPLDADALEDVLFCVGEMGLYQKLMFIGMLPFTTFYIWVYLVQIFVTVTPEKYWCRNSVLEALPMELRRNLTAPGAATGTWDKCHTFDVDWNEVLNTLAPPPPGTRQIPCPEGWEFEFTDIPYASVVVERGWVCSKAAYVPTAQSLFFVGSLMGSFVFGWVADNYGRIPALVGANLIGGIGGILTIFTSSLWDFVICRFLVGLAFDNCFMIPYILILEYVGPGQRTWVANLPLAIFGGGAGIALPWIAYFACDWRLTLWITSLPMFGAIVAPWLMPESVRWLVSRGRINDAIKILRKFERINKTTIPDDVMESFVTTSKKMGSRKMESFVNIFRNTLLRRTMIYMIIVYSSDDVIYDTLVRLTQVFGFDFFITFTINMAIEIPAVLLLTLLLDRVGRRLLTGGTLFVGGVSLFCAMLVPKGLSRVSLGVIARFVIKIAFTVLCQWGTEILPTPFRASGSAFLHMTGFAASLLSPFIVFSETFWAPLPLLIVSTWALITAVLTFLLPETKGQEMPQTVHDSEKIIVTQSLLKVGRRLLTGGTLFVGGVSLFCAMLVPKGLSRVSLGVIARFVIKIAFTVLCQWGTEILPTPFRASGSAFLHMTGFAASLLSPFIVFSETFWAPLPLLIVSTWALITAVLTFLLPETKGQEMPQTVHDSEKIIVTQSLLKQPEMKEFKNSLSKILSSTVGDTIHRDPSGRVSRLSRLRLH